MQNSEIIVKLNSVFCKVFKDDSLLISNELTANDVEGWDSLTHMLLISEVENVFDLKFKLKDLNKMKNVGDMISIIESRLAE